MKKTCIVSAIILSFAAGSVVADVEFSSLVQWEESQKPTERSVTAKSSDDVVSMINNMDATAAGGGQFSSLIQWEESQYATPYAFSIDDINNMEATAAGGIQNQLSSLIQWEGSAH